VSRDEDDGPPILACVPEQALRVGRHGQRRAIAAGPEKGHGVAEQGAERLETATDQARALRGVHARIDPGNVVESDPPSVPTHHMCDPSKGKSDSKEDLVGKGAHGQERHGNERKEELIFDLLS
jgi:hypothetical protein